MNKKKNKEKRINTFFSNCLKESVQNITSVHGIGQIANKKGRYKYVWIVLMVANMFLTAGYILVVRQKYYDGHIITEIDTECKVNQVPFPAVSVCNMNLVSITETKNIMKILKQNNRTDKEINRFLRTLTRINDYSHHYDRSNNFKEIMSVLKRHYYTLDTIMEEVHQKCEDLFVFCSFNRIKKNCNDMFRLIKTYEGYCCTFNYGSQDEGSENPLFSQGNSFEYYDDDSDDKGPTARMIASSEAGRLSGLFVIFDVEPEDYASWSTAPFIGAKILLSDPNDYAEISVKYRYLTPHESLDIKMEPMIFRTESSLRRLDPKERNCMFHDEVHLDQTDRYSYEMCYSECLMSTFFKYCQCVPYKYPMHYNTRVCEIEDYKCLHNISAYNSLYDLDCDPVCYIECGDKKYGMSSDSTIFLTDTVPADAKFDGQTSHLSALRVYYVKPTCSCYTLKMMIDFSYLIGNKLKKIQNKYLTTYGGVFSLSFGGSIITIIELLYLFFIFIIALLSYVFEMMIHGLK